MTHKFQRKRLARGEAPEAILAAAAELFGAQGYGATSIVDIAAKAGVARPTIFTAVGPKAEIFRAVLGKAVGGDPLEIAVGHRPWVHEVLSQPTAPRMLGLYVHQVRLIGERISDLYWAAECGAETYPEIRPLFEAMQADRLSISGKVGAALASITDLAEGYDAQRAGLVLNTLISPASWRAFVTHAGWSPDQFEEWGVKSVSRLLLANGHA